MLILYNFLIQKYYLMFTYIHCLFGALSKCIPGFNIPANVLS